MEISFKTNRLKKICSENQVMQKDLGAEMAKKLQQRLMELNAAESLYEMSHLPPPRCHKLDGNREGQFSVDLVHPYRLIFAPTNDPIPRNEDGELDREKVTEIEIIEIVDPHK